CLAGDLAAGGAALLVATSPQNIAISQYARAYALLILCLMCAFFCLVRARQLAVAQPPAGRPRRLWWWSGYTIAAAASLYTHHVATVVVGALNISVLLGLVGIGYAGRR